MLQIFFLYSSNKDYGIFYSIKGYFQEASIMNRAILFIVVISILSLSVYSFSLLCFMIRKTAKTMPV
jgi:hypothetical protein